MHRDARSCAERSVKRKKCDFHLRDTRTAGRARWFFRAILAAMCQHIDAWRLYAAPHLT
jgi:CRISPR/Cas system CMR-associated protein Cmr1 (group 7 of RAMP superfamily)